MDGASQITIYSSETQRLAQLEQRSTRYRFDLERDPQWERSNEAGIHAPSEMLEDFGVDTASLAHYADTFDWVYAASVCRSFVFFEECVIGFLEREREHRGVGEPRVARHRGVETHRAVPPL